MTNKAPRLPSRAEALLKELPIPELDWEAQARAIDRKIESVEVGSMDATLLQVPELDAESGEHASLVDGLAIAGRDDPGAAAPKQSSTSLSDLARSMAPRSTREESNALFKQSLSVAAAARAQLPATVRQHASNAPTLRAPPDASTRRGEAPRSTLGPFLAGAGVAIAAAAVVALVLRGPSQAPAPVVVHQTPVVSQPATTTPARSDEQKAAEETAPKPVSPTAEPPAMALAPEPAVANTERPVGATKPAAPVARPPGVPKTAPPKPERVVLEETPQTPATTASPEPGLRPASGASNTIPDHPSNGATQAALGSVLGAARACVAGMPGASTASIVFNSDGRVAKVNVSGPAAGTPAGACIQSALGRARVSPFTKPTFVVNGVTIRP